MKKLLVIFFSSLIIAFSGTALAQNAPVKTKPDTGTVGKDIKKATKATGKAIGKGAKAVAKGAKKVGKKSAEVGAKGAAKIKDKTLKNRKGPNGETVYVNKYDQKYYVDKHGRWIYLDD